MRMPCGCYEWPMAQPWAPYYYSPYGYWPAPQAWPPVRGALILPQEILAGPDAPEQDAFVGGQAGVHLVLEYMPETGGAGAVAVDITDGGNTTNWTEDPIAAGYHVKHDFQEVAPGATLHLVAKGGIARLRWCEVVEY